MPVGNMPSATSARCCSRRLASTRPACGPAKLRSSPPRFRQPPFSVNSSCRCQRQQQCHAQQQGAEGRPAARAAQQFQSPGPESPQANAQQAQPQASDAVWLVLMSLALTTLAEPDAAHAASPLEAVKDFAAQTSGPEGVVAFIAAYVAATVLLVPGSLLTLAAGALYGQLTQHVGYTTRLLAGPLKGTAVVSAASTLGALAAFLVARTAARPWVEEKVRGSPQVSKILSGVSQQGFKLVLLLRLSPLVPFTLLNYALGLTSVSALEYTVASWAGMLPGTFAYVYLGGAGAAAVSSVGQEAGVEPVQLLLWGVGAVATLWSVKLVSDAASQALKQDSSSTGPSSSDQLQ